MLIRAQAVSNLIKEEAASKNLAGFDEPTDQVGDRTDIDLIGFVGDEMELFDDDDIAPELSVDAKVAMKLIEDSKTTPDLIDIVAIMVKHNLAIHTEKVVSEAHDLELAKNKHIDDDIIPR